MSVKNANKFISSNIIRAGRNTMVIDRIANAMDKWDTYDLKDGEYWVPIKESDIPIIETYDWDRSNLPILMEHGNLHSELSEDYNIRIQRAAINTPDNIFGAQSTIFISGSVGHIRYIDMVNNRIAFHPTSDFVKENIDKACMVARKLTAFGTLIKIITFDIQFDKIKEETINGNDV